MTDQQASQSDIGKGRIMITGASGVIGSRIVNHLHANGYTCICSDIVPLPPHVPQPLPPGSSFTIVDITDYKAVEIWFSSTAPPIFGVLHLGAHSRKDGKDPREINRINVVGSYNILSTAADHGVKRIVQASSVNATGLNFTAEERKLKWELPVHEGSECRPEDAYSLTKQICELQADSICRTHPELRIVSLRFGHTNHPLTLIRSSCSQDLWGGTSYASAADACLLGLTSEHPDLVSGHQAFYIVADDITLTDESREAHRPGGWAERSGGRSMLEIGTLEMLEWAYPGTKTSKGWWTEGRERRGLHNTEKAKRLLGWVYRDEFRGGDEDGLKG